MSDRSVMEEDLCKGKWLGSAGFLGKRIVALLFLAE